MLAPKEAPDFILKQNRIDIWYYPINRQPINAIQLLNEEERERAFRFYFKHHQQRFIEAHAIVRSILGRYLDSPPEQLSFAKNKQGKPHLIHPTCLTFNLSHSGDYALLAVGYQKALGIDLEFFSSRPYQGIAKLLFSNAEIAYLMHQIKSLQPFTFFKLWAQKEAFIKAVGLGLAYPTQTFSVLNQPIVDQQTHQSWHMLTFMPRIGCHAALCYHPSIHEIRYFSLTDTQSLL